jgi:hypothetical protein
VLNPSSIASLTQNLLRAAFPLCASFFLLSSPVAAHADVITYPAPQGEPLSPDYTLEVSGHPVPVHPIKTQHRDGKYSAAYFDFSGPATVKIKTSLPLGKLAILPAKYNIKPTVENGQVTFTTDKPFNISFEPTGADSPLLLFSNPIEKVPPKPGDPNVIYFGPGSHNSDTGLIKLTSNQTLYIAGGAVVHAGIDASGDNIRIMGRGILDGSDWVHNGGPNDYMINATDCRNLLIQDILIKGSYYWTVVPQRCDQVLIQNLRLVGSRVGNDDGIDPCNSSNVTIRNCFLRTDDDSISPKGITRAGGESTSRTCDNILVEDCTFFVDFANAFRIATESSCPAIRNFTARNIDVIHFPARNQVSVFLLDPTGSMPMENLTFENIRINGDTNANLVRIQPRQPLVGSRPIEVPRPNDIKSGPGRRGGGGRGYGEFVVIPADSPYVHNVTFKDIQVYGNPPSASMPTTAPTRGRGNASPPGNGAVVLTGFRAKQDIANITFDNLTRFGIPLTADSPNIRLGNFVTNVQFLPH